MWQISSRQKLKHLHATLLCSWGLGLGLAHCEPASVDLTPVELEETSIELAQQQTQQLPKATSSITTVPIPPAIVTTRPSFTDSWLSVPQGSFQAESGATYTDNSNHTRNWVLPESLLKLGLTRNTEFRFAVPNYTDTRDDDAGEITSNFGDLGVGISHHIGLPHKIDVALIPFLNLPTGAKNVSSNSLDPQFRAVVAKTVTPKLVFASQLDTRWYTGKDVPAKVVMNPTLISYYSFTDKFTGFVEYGGFYPTEGKTGQYLQGGMLYLPTRRQQLDIRIAKGLNSNSSDIIVGFGYSFRIDGLFGESKPYGTFRKASIP